MVRSNTRSVVPTFVAGVVKTSLATMINTGKSSFGNLSLLSIPVGRD